MRRRTLSVTLTALAVALCAAVAFAADPTGTEPQQLNLSASGNEGDPDLTGIQDGGFAVVYETSHHAQELQNRLLMRRFDADGDPLAAEENAVETNENNTNNQASIAGNANGRIAIAWTTYNQATTGMDVIYRVWNSSGDAVTGENDVWPLVQDKEGGQEHPDVDMAADGTFVIVWNAQDADGSDPGMDGAIFARRFNADGGPMTDREFVGFTSTDDGDPGVSVAEDGSFVVGWNDYRPGGGAMIRRFVTSQPPGQPLQLAPAGDAVKVGDGVTGSHSHPQPLVLNDRVLVTWEVDNGTSDVLARRFTTGLEPVGDVVTVNTVFSGSQWAPEIAQTPDGSVGISWGESAKVKWRQFDTALAPLSGEITVTDFYKSTTPIAGTGHQFVLAWEGETDDPATESEIFGRRYAVAPAPATSTPSPTPTASPQPTVVPTPAPTVTPPAVVPLPKLSAISKFPKTCRKRRLRLSFRNPPGLRLKKVVVKVNGKRRKTLRRPGSTTLRKLPKRKVTIDVSATLTDDRIVKGKKRYRSCR